MSRIGIFGGTFDPPHAGHLAVARAALAQLALDRIELIPSAIPPHRGAPAASAADRLAMLALATTGDPKLVPSPRELERGGTSYTVDTLRALAAEEPGAELFLILGADSYDELPGWREAAEIQRLAHLVVLPRPLGPGAAPGRLRPEDEPRLRAAADAPPTAEKAVYRLLMEPVPVGARELRAAFAGDEDTAAVPAGPEEQGSLALAADDEDDASGPLAALDPAVRAYIRKRGLYRIL